jgi:hypothetical protein
MQIFLRAFALTLAASIPLGLAACGSSGGGTTVDMSTPADLAKVKAPDMTVLISQCGQPGDVGNSIGVGKFCTKQSDCNTGNLKTNLCSAIGNSGGAGDTYFCTVFPCHLDGGVAECGENATCECGSGGGMTGCACTPNSCLGDSTDAGTK